MNLLRTTLFIIFVIATANAQLRVTTIEKLPITLSAHWNQPQFSSDGHYLYFTTAEFNGIWEYSIQSKSCRMITQEPQSGLGFALSKDGKHISYRRSMSDERTHERVQDIVLADLATGESQVVVSGNDLSAPAFVQNELSYTAGKQVHLPSRTDAAEINILGIENTKIAIDRNGQKVLFDPLGNGSYVWPSLSPDKKKVLAYEMGRGAFICDLDGANVVFLGRLDAPNWTRDGKWIVFMDDKDDGRNITSSEIWAIAEDGGQRVQLTVTDRIVEMYPSCSPTENKIACSALSGELYLISYTEVPR